MNAELEKILVAMSQVLSTKDAAIQTAQTASNPTLDELASLIRRLLAELRRRESNSTRIVQSPAGLRDNVGELLYFIFLISVVVLVKHVTNKRGVTHEAIRA